MGILLKNIVCGLGLLLLSVGKDNRVSGAEYGITIYTKEGNGHVGCREESLFEAITQVVWCVSREKYLESNGHHSLPLDIFVDPSELHNPNVCSSGITDLERQILHSYVDHRCGESRRRRVESATAERQNTSTELSPLSTTDVEENNNKLLRGGDDGNRELSTVRGCCYCTISGAGCYQSDCNGFDCNSLLRRQLTQENDINDNLSMLFQDNMEIVLERDEDQQNFLFRHLYGITVHVHAIEV